MLDFGLRNNNFNLTIRIHIFIRLCNYSFFIKLTTMKLLTKITSTHFFVYFIMILFGSINELNSQEKNQNNEMAKIVSVEVSGNETSYSFKVGISSPDTGCDQYANWWEVISEDGELIYRRILGHSHVNEQPFVRSGGKVSILNNQIVIVRVHMNTSGYGTKTFKGSVNNGFTAFDTDQNFAKNLANIKPLPTGCAF